MELPAWAWRAAKAEDRDPARAAQACGAMQVAWPDREALRRWAGDHGWAAPTSGFEDAFSAQMLETDASFALAIEGSGIALRIPVAEHTLTREQLADLDAWYDELSPTGHRISWGLLVEALREIRRAVEAGVAVHVEGGETLRTWAGFYDWAHGRYHKLEESFDKWIGNDDP